MVLPVLALIVACAGSQAPAQLSPVDAADNAEPAVCSTNEDCAETEYCSRPQGECEAEGTCRDRPEVCTQIYTPVCGCDGKTYSSPCHAAAVGQSVDYRGECEEPGG